MNNTKIKKYSSKPKENNYCTRKEQKTVMHLMPIAYLIFIVIIHIFVLWFNFFELFFYIASVDIVMC
jgi:hypothetical protein